jgi:hypothetical protein
MCTHVAKLGERGVEQPVLLPKRDFFANLGLCRLEMHIGIGNLGDGREVKHGAQTKDKARDAKINRLHILQGSLVVDGEEDVRAQRWRDDGTDPAKRLSNVEP